MKYVLVGNRWCGKSEYLTSLGKAYIRAMIMLGQGNSTLMIASPNDPVEKVPKVVWYEDDGLTKYDVIWEDRLRSPTKTCYEWAKELGISYEM